jgi:putative ABC transport system substrate-binding protein
MRRRDFFGGAAGVAIALGTAGRVGAQRASEMHRIGVLASSPPLPGYTFPTIFRQALAELGWVEGANIVLDWRGTGGKPEAFSERAAELVAGKPEVIVATTPAAVIAVHQATASIPIVMVNTSDPVELSIVESLSRPGGNVTGTSSVSADISLKQLDLLTEMLPGVKRVAVLATTSSPWHPIALSGLEAGARNLGLGLVVMKVSAGEELAGAVTRIAADAVEAVIVLADPITFVHRGELVALLARQRIPAVYSLREYAEAGGLMSYWADSAALYRRTAFYVDRILRGTQPAELPIEQPTRFELIINLRTARSLGLTVPPNMLARADEIIE